MATRQETIREVAASQKLILWTLLLAIIINIAIQAISIGIRQQRVEPQVLLLFGVGSMIAAFGLIAFQIYGVVRLCLALKEGWATAIYVICQFIPCLSLILLLFLNGRATKYLQANGIRVGLMGAKQADLDRLSDTTDSTSLTCPACGEELEAGITICPVCGRQR